MFYMNMSCPNCGEKLAQSERADFCMSCDYSYYYPDACEESEISEEILPSNTL